jgi:soluble lytic murein transglycosylase
MAWLTGAIATIMLLGVLQQSSRAAETVPYEQRLGPALALMQQGAWQQAVETLGELADGPLTPALARLWFVRGTLAQKLLEPEIARQAFSRVWQGYPPLADYAAWALVQAEAAQDLFPALQKTVAALAERYPLSRWLPESQLVLARAQHRLGQAVLARATLERILREAPEHPIVPEALALLAQVHEEHGEVDLAIQTLRRLGETYPRDKQAAAALRHSRELAARLPETQRPPAAPEALLASVERLAEGQLWQEIEARLSALETLQLPEPLTITLLVKRGMVDTRRGRWAEASAILQDVLRRYPQGAHLPETAYWLGTVYQRQKQEAQGVQTYELGLAQPAVPLWTPKILWALARLQEERQEFARAVELYQRLAQEFPSYEQAENSLWQAGWLEYRQRHTQAAATVWQSFELRFPRSSLLPQVLYWQARAMQHSGQQEQSVRLYQRILGDYASHYYSTQAQTNLQAVGARSTPAVPSLPSTPVTLSDASLLATPAPGKPNPAQFHMIRAQEWQQLQMYPQATQEIRAFAAVLPPTPAAQYALASLYVDNQQRPAAFRVLYGMVEALSPPEVRGLPREFWTTLYPQVFWSEITQQASATNLNPYLVLSIIRQESAFNPTAISSSGARGLMQLMPATAQEVLTKLKLQQEPVIRLHDPQLSITLGTTYFANLMRRFQGNVVLALAGYNAGPGRATRWRAQWAGTPLDECIERIPLDETRGYVKLILRNLMMYERLYKVS